MADNNNEECFSENSDFERISNLQLDEDDQQLEDGQKTPVKNASESRFE